MADLEKAAANVGGPSPRRPRDWSSASRSSSWWRSPRWRASTLLVVGPPGTAKSEAVRRIARGLGGNYFEYLLGRFTEPSEISLHTVAPPAERARLFLRGARRCSMHLLAGHLTVGDDRGRLLALDLLEGAIRRDLRI